MAGPEAKGPQYSVQCSTAIARDLKSLQALASLEGRGKLLLAAFQEVIGRLQVDPTEVGEPLYRLPALKMQVRMVVLRPLALDFAVVEDAPVVFIKGVGMLSK
jgi:hypothetical protein